MGFQLPVLKLTFAEATGLAGLEVRMRRPSCAQLVEGQALERGDVKAVRSICDLITPAIIAWNLEDDDGQPVPVDADELYRRDANLALTIMSEWMTNAAGVPRPLSTPSSPGGTGETEALANLPMSPPNSTGPD